MSNAAYVFDPKDPRAPTEEQWSKLDPEERARVVGQLPSEFPAETTSYVPIVPQVGRWESRVLGLDLMLEDGRVRFFAGSAPLLEADELIARLSSMVDKLGAKEEELARALDREQARALSAEQRAEAAETANTRLGEQLRRLGIKPDE